jgi:hypothetical protein
MYPNSPEASMVLSSNWSASIDAADRWWSLTGTVAVVLLSIVTSLAYWHQKRLHRVFRLEADSIDNKDSVFELRSGSRQTVGSSREGLTSTSTSESATEHQHVHIEKV